MAEKGSGQLKASGGFHPNIDCGIGRARASILTMERMVSLKARAVLLDVAGRAAVPLHVLQEVPAFGLVKDGEEQGELLHSQLPPENGAQHPTAADDQWPNEPRVQVLLLPASQEKRVCLGGEGCSDTRKQDSREGSGGPVRMPGPAPTPTQGMAQARWEGHAGFTGGSPLCPRLTEVCWKCLHVLSREVVSVCPTVQQSLPH